MSLKHKVKYPVSLIWRIPELPLLQAKNSNYEKLTSQIFDIPGTDIQYYIEVFPNGRQDNYPGKTMLYFCLEFSTVEQIEVAELSFSLEGSTYRKRCKESVIYEKPKKLGMIFCDGDDLSNGFIVDGLMKIEVATVLIIEQDIPVKTFELGSCADSLCINLWNQENKDFIIVADGKEIKAHKNVLSARSPVFEAMLKPHTKEAQESKVTIPDFPFKIVEAAIKLCYHHSLVDEISLDDAIFLLHFFNKYDIQSLREQLEERVIAAIDASNVCSLVNCAIDSNSPKLKGACTKFLKNRLQNQEAVCELDSLNNKDYALKLLEFAFCKISM